MLKVSQMTDYMHGHEKVLLQAWVYIGFAISLSFLLAYWRCICEMGLMDIVYQYGYRHIIVDMRYPCGLFRPWPYNPMYFRPWPIWAMWFKFIHIDNILPKYGHEQQIEWMKDCQCQTCHNSLPVFVPLINLIVAPCNESHVSLSILSLD